MTGRTAQKTGITAQPASRQTARTERTPRQPQRPAEAAETAAKKAAKKSASKAKPARQAKKELRLRYANIKKHNVDALVVFTVEDPRSPRGVGRDQRYEVETVPTLEGYKARKMVHVNLFDVDILTLGEGLKAALEEAGKKGIKSVAFFGEQIKQMAENKNIGASHFFRIIANLLGNQEAVRRVDIICKSTEEYAQLNRFVEEAEKEGTIGARVNVPVRRQISRQALEVYGALDGWGTQGKQ